MILTSLEKHPKVFAHEQLFGAKSLETRHIFVRGLTNAQVGERCFDRKTLQISDDTAIVFPCAPGMREEDKATSFWGWVDSRSDIQLLHLRRRNVLKAYVSQQVALLTGAWGNRYPAVEAEPRITVNREAAEVYLKWDLKDSLACQARYANRPHMAVFYEDLMANPKRLLNLIQQFIGVEPIDIWPRTKKQATRSLRDAITNYDQLVSDWKGTEYEQYLE